MQKTMRVCLALAALAVLMTGCAAQTEENPMPSPTVSASASPEPSPSQAAEQGQPMAFVPVGEDAKITVGDKTLTARAYFMDGDEMLLPVSQTAEALGWTVETPNTAGATEMTFAREGEDTVTVTGPMSSGDADAVLTEIAVRRGEEDVDIGDTAVAMIDGELYAAEAFFDKVLEPIDVSYDEGTQITVEVAA